MLVGSTVLAACFVVLVLAGFRQEHQSPPKVVFVKTRPELPFIYLFSKAPMPLPGSSVEMARSRVLVAIWQDGTIVTGPLPQAHPGADSVMGTLTKAELDETVRVIEESGILSTPPRFRTPECASYESLSLRLEGRLITWAKNPTLESIGHFGIARVREYLLDLEPAESKPVDKSHQFSADWFEP